MFAGIAGTLVRDLTEIKTVRQDLIDVASCEWLSATATTSCLNVHLGAQAQQVSGFFDESRVGVLSVELKDGLNCDRFDLANDELQLKLGTDGGKLEALSRRGKSWTVGEAAEYTGRVAWKRAVSSDKMQYLAREAIEFFGATRRLNTINTEALDHWVLTLEARGLSDGSINHRLAAISRMMTTAMERGGLDAKPRIPRKKRFDARMRIISVKEEIEMQAHLKQLGFDLHADALVVLVDSGMRLGELLRLRESDIDFNSGLVHVWQTKNRSNRSVPMTRRVRARLHPLIQGHPGRRVFPFTSDAFYGVWTRLRARMGLEEDQQFTAHALRHTCASRMVQKGISLQVVQNWMGHKSYRSTLRYAHLAPENLHHARAALESYMV